MEILTAFFNSFWLLSGAMAFYILFGLFFAGILHEIVPSDFVQKHLGKGNFLSVLKSTLFGIPLPVCSCGVIPLATALKKEGASKGAVLAFLISTPITGIDSILATFGIFGFVFTLYRVVTSVVIAFFAGIFSNIFDKEKRTRAKFSLFNNPKTAVSFTPLKFDTKKREIKKRFSFKNALYYGFVTLFGDIAKPLFWGLVIGAVITVIIPENMSELLGLHRWIGYVGAISIAVPMYICATSSLPIAASLVLSGVSMGAAFVFLSAGPATNTVTMGVVKKMLGSKSLFIYLSVISIGSVVFGLMLDALFGSLSLDPKSIVNVHEEGSMMESVGSVILYAFLAYFLIKPYFKSKISL